MFSFGRIGYDYRAAKRQAALDRGQAALDNMEPPPDMSCVDDDLMDENMADILMDLKNEGILEAIDSRERGDW